MSVAKKRPVNLDLTTLKFPLSAIVSICHRISGVALFLMFPLLVYLLQESLRSKHQFEAVKLWLQNPFLKVALFGFLVAIIYHTVAGTRHLLMDFGFGETLLAARRSAIVVFALTLLGSITLGWLWLVM
jgi:succinate dehydrogenase cytochrome b subunit